MGGVIVNVFVREGIWGHARESVRDSVVLAADVNERKIILRQKFLPSELTAGKIPLRIEILEGTMIRVYQEFGAHQIGAPFFEGSNNREKLLLMYRVILFRCMELHGIEGDRTRGLP